MNRVKLRRSAGFSNLVSIVEGRSSSVRSGGAREFYVHTETDVETRLVAHTFLDSDLGGAGLWFLLGRLVLILLHAPNLARHVRKRNLA